VRTVLRDRHAASAAPIGVHGGPWKNGQISSAMPRQSAVADSSPSTANRPRLIRCRITYERGIRAYAASGLRKSKNFLVTVEAYSPVMVRGPRSRTVS
jgi:hypothetical protein